MTDDDGSGRRRWAVLLVLHGGIPFFFDGRVLLDLHGRLLLHGSEATTAVACASVSLEGQGFDCKRQEAEERQL